MNMMVAHLEHPVTTILRRFALEEPDSLGLSCNGSGLSLAGAPLLVEAVAGLRPRTEQEIDLLLRAAYKREFDTACIMQGLGIVAGALNAGDVERAMVAALHLRLPPLDPDGAVRLGKVEDLIAKYSPDQPRDWHGRWTAGGGGGSDQSNANTSDRRTTGLTSAAGSPIGSNAMRIEPHAFQASPASPDDVPAVVRGFIESGAALSVRQLTQGDGREIAGDVQSTPSGYVVENAKWGNIENSRLPVGDQTVPVTTVAFYFHSHSSTPSAGAIDVYPGPSAKDVDNSRNEGIWQAVIDSNGYV